MIALVLIIGIAAVIGVTLLAIYSDNMMISNKEKEEDPNQYIQLKAELMDALFLNTTEEINEDDQDAIAAAAAKFVTERSMDFYKNGFENGLKATVEKIEIPTDDEQAT